MIEEISAFVGKGMCAPGLGLGTDRGYFRVEAPAIVLAPIQAP